MHASLRTKIDKKPTESITDCVACILRPMLLIGSICGYPLTSVRCPHSNDPFPVAKFSKPRILTIISSMYTIPIILGTIDYCTNNFTSLAIQPVKALSIIFEILLGIGAVVTNLSGVVGSKETIVELNGLSAIIENRQYYGFHTILNKKITKVFIIGNYFGLAAIAGEMVLYLFLAIVVDYSSYNKVRTVVLTLNNYIHGMLLVQFVIMHFLYYILFKKCLNAIRVLLTERSNVPHTRKITFVLSKRLPFDVNLRRLIRLYLGLVYNYKQLNMFLGLPLLLWFTMFACLLIIHFYTTTIVVLSHDHAETIFTIRAYGSIGVIALFAIGGETMKSMNKDTLSFLFKYPISKLSAAEAAQVEMFITTLMIRKPLLKASDIFKVETRLFASITGTVVTYVLVALQFHAKWSKQK